jgi:hypothetical protein
MPVICNLQLDYCSDITPPRPPAFPPRTPPPSHPPSVCRLQLLLYALLYRLYPACAGSLRRALPPSLSASPPPSLRGHSESLLCAKGHPNEEIRDPEKKT